MEKLTKIESKLQELDQTVNQILNKINYLDNLHQEQLDRADLKRAKGIV